MSVMVWLFTQAFIQGPDQRKHQSSASLAFVRGIHRWPVNSPRKGPVTRKIFTFYDVIMSHGYEITNALHSKQRNWYIPVTNPCNMSHAISSPLCRYNMILVAVQTRHLRNVFVSRVYYPVQFILQNCQKNILWYRKTLYRWVQIYWFICVIQAADGAAKLENSLNTYESPYPQGCIRIS